MKTKSILLLAATIALVVLMVGCGGGSPGSSGGQQGGDETESGEPAGAPIATSSLGKEEFLEQANLACQRQKKGLIDRMSNYVKQHHAEARSEGVLIADLAKVVLVPSVEREIAAVRRLGAPEGDEEEIEAILAAQEKGVEEVKNLRQAKSLEEVEDHFIKATKLYEEYGFTACINSPAG